jgi:hypothetical protein
MMISLRRRVARDMTRSHEHWSGEERTVVRHGTGTILTPATDLMFVRPTFFSRRVTRAGRIIARSSLRRVFLQVISKPAGWSIITP